MSVCSLANTSGSSGWYIGISVYLRVLYENWLHVCWTLSWRMHSLLEDTIILIHPWSILRFCDLAGEFVLLQASKVLVSLWRHATIVATLVCSPSNSLTFDRRGPWRKRCRNQTPTKIPLVETTGPIILDLFGRLRKHK
jgi:hypothetical protein